MKQSTTAKSARALGAALLLATAWHASGQSADALVNKLVEKGIITQQEAADLKKESDQDFAKSMAARSPMPSWTKNVAFSGDFRLRMDDLWAEKSLNLPERLRVRMRLRYGGVWTATDWATIGVRLGTGDSGYGSGEGNPNSNNQTFTHNFSKKPLYVDAAYVTIRPPDEDWISVTGGKMNKILWEPSLNSPMVYDPDVTPEGGVEQLSYKFGPDNRFQAFGNLGEFVLDEFKSTSRDAYMIDGQVGLTANLIGEAKAPALKTTVAGGYLTTMGLKSVPTADGSGNKGNYTTGANYFANFDVIYGRGEAAWKICKDPVLGTPAVLTFGGEYDKNLNGAYATAAAGDHTTAYTGQIMFGNAAKKGNWQVAYQYKYLGADAVYDSLTDDDFGGTDRKGHIVKAAYNIKDWWQIGATAFWTEKISDRANSGHNQVGIAGQNQTRLFLDMMFKF